MQWYALTHIGGEHSLKAELETLGITAEPRMGGVFFTASKAEAATVLYYSQCMTRLLLAITEGTYERLDSTKAHELLPEDETFKVEVDIIPGGPTRSRMECASELGERIERTVDLEGAQNVVFCQLGTQCLCGLDVAGDLSKRYYRIFANSQSVKGTLAAVIVYGEPEVRGLLDPFSNTGEVCVEAALRSTHTSPRKYEKHLPVRVLEQEYRALEDDVQEPSFSVWCVAERLGNLRSCKKNAKLAGVEKAMSFSKLEPEWMDVKFSEDSLSHILTIPPPITHRQPEDTHIKELCYQAQYVLRPGGRLVVACTTPDTAAAFLKHAKSYKLRFVREYVVFTGEKPVQVMTYEL